MKSWDYWKNMSHGHKQGNRDTSILFGPQTDVARSKKLDKKLPIRAQRRGVSTVGAIFYEMTQYLQVLHNLLINIPNHHKDFGMFFFSMSCELLMMIINVQTDFKIPQSQSDKCDWWQGVRTQVQPGREVGSEQLTENLLVVLLLSPSWISMAFSQKGTRAGGQCGSVCGQPNEELLLLQCTCCQIAVPAHIWREGVLSEDKSTYGGKFLNIT